MKIRSLQWEDFYDNGKFRRSYSRDIPQILYVIRIAWDEFRGVRQYAAEFSHGYQNRPQVLGQWDTTEEAKDIANTHFRDYVQGNFLEPEVE